MATLNFPASPSNGDTFTQNNIEWQYDATYNVWNISSSGVMGFTGSVGYTGSRGDIGYVGSKGDLGYTGSTGYTGSKGDTGYVGSQGIKGPAGLSYTSAINVSSNTATVTEVLYILTANATLTLPATPSNFDYVGVTNLSGFANSLVARNGEKIMGLTEDLTIDVANGGFSLFYSGSTVGWIIL